MAMAGVAIGAALIGAGGTWLVDRAQPPAGSKGEVERIVRDYLLSNPELIPEAMQKLQDRRTGELIAANRGTVETPVGDAWAGNPKGDVTVVEFFDYNCGYCRASLPTLRALIAAEPGVRIVYKEAPVLSAESGQAARLSLAAARLGRFRRFHDALYAGGPVSDASLSAAARAAGLDYAQLTRTAEAPAVEDAIRANLELMRPLGMTGTPSWVIGDRVIVGAQSLDELRAAVKAARGK